MSILSWIILSSLLGGVLSVSVAAVATYTISTARLSMLVSYAIGALLGAVFLELLPHALEQANPHQITVTVLMGILAFFVLEKLVLWRHCHHDHCEAHDAQPISYDHGRSGFLILVGNVFHNFVDGMLIAAAFMQSIELGIVTALAIIAHEIPQELGDFLVLIHSGYSRLKALWFNLLSSFATLFGGLLAYFALFFLQSWIPFLLGLAAASMLYVAVADLIPGLHKRTELGATVQQVLLIGLGIVSIWGVRELIAGHA